MPPFELGQGPALPVEVVIDEAGDHNFSSLNVPPDRTITLAIYGAGAGGGARASAMLAGGGGGGGAAVLLTIPAATWAAGGTITLGGAGGGGVVDGGAGNPSDDSGVLFTVGYITCLGAVGGNSTSGVGGVGGTIETAPDAYTIVRQQAGKQGASRMGTTPGAGGACGLNGPGVGGAGGSIGGTVGATGAAARAVLSWTA